MIKLHQGDTSDIITLNSDEEFKMTDEWSARLVIVSSKTNTRPLLQKFFFKDYKNKQFWTALLPEETSALLPGNYVMGFQIENPSIFYRREIHEKLRILPQVVFNEYRPKPEEICDFQTCPYSGEDQVAGDHIFYTPKEDED